MVNRTVKGLRRNKANFRRAGYPIIPLFHHSSVPGLVRRAKQSQSAVAGRQSSVVGWEDRCTNKASWRRTFKLEVSSVKQEKQMVGASNFTLYTSHSAEGRSCETKPISVGRPELRRAKCAKRTQSPASEIPHRSSIPLSQHSSPMPIVQNKANFPHTDGNGRRPPGSSVRNKANSPRGSGRASALREKGYGEWNRQEASEKQSQSPPVAAPMPSALTLGAVRVPFVSHAGKNVLQPLTDSRMFGTVLT